MKISNNNDVTKLSTNVRTKRELAEKERKLMELISETPIVIDYGCHHIELSEKDHTFNGYSFYATKFKDGVLHIRII